jgi:uncharacterized protein DUF6221
MAVTAIVEFLLARIAEDEAVARVGDAASYPAPWSTEQVDLDTYGVASRVVCDGGSGDVVGDPIDDDLAAHIARWDPARVLAECATKRRLITEHRPIDGMCGHCSQDEEQPAPVGWWVPTPCETLLALAAIYADHPDYDPAWAATP